MKSRALLLVTVAACSSSARERAPEPAPEPVSRAPAPLAVLFERTLPGGEERAPLFGPGGSITVGQRQWARDGRFLGRHAWGINGQVRPIGVIGTADRPLILAIGWGEFSEQPAGAADRAYLIATYAHAEKPLYATPVDHEFLEDGMALQPLGSGLVASEGPDIVVRALPSGAELVRTPHFAAKTDDAPVACWVDNTRVAWIGRNALQTLEITSGKVATTRIGAVGPLRCDPSGGVAAMEAPAGTVRLVDLATGATLATAALEPAKPGTEDDEIADAVIAVGQRGARFAIAYRDTLTVYARSGELLAPLYQHALIAGAPVRMVFAPDGERLAVATTALTVLGPVAEVHPGIAPRLAFELPRGFTTVPTRSKEQEAWRWAQLGGPSGMAPQSALLVNAVEQENQFSDVTAIAIARDEFANVPAPDATDEQLTAFATQAMPQLFEQWENAKIGTERDAEFTARVGRTKGMPWFETREIWRDGCEPYDGYTRVVIDRDAVFVIRALTAPGSSIDGWLAKFFDLPFGMRVQTARRHGPRSGPC